MFYQQVWNSLKILEKIIRIFGTEGAPLIHSLSNLTTVNRRYIVICLCRKIKVKKLLEKIYLKFCNFVEFVKFANSLSINSNYNIKLKDNSWIFLIELR